MPEECDRLEISLEVIAATLGDARLAGWDGFGLAIPKMDPATGQHAQGYVEIYQKLQAEALTLFPSGQLPPDFSMKFKDGDAVDHVGKPFSDREGYAGHTVSIL